MTGDKPALPVILRMIEALTPGFRLNRCFSENPLDRLRKLDVPVGERVVFSTAQKLQAEMARNWRTARRIWKCESRAAARWSASA